MRPTFVADAKVHDVAVAYTGIAVEMARGKFRFELDWSDDSIKLVETMLGTMCELYRSRQMSEGAAVECSRILGSYTGEVFRRNHGATWGWVTLGGERYPGLKSVNGTLFWPWVKAHGRIEKGPEDNILHYYQVLLSQTTMTE